MLLSPRPPTVHSVSLNLEPGMFLSGWRPNAGALFLPTLSDSRVGDEVAVRLGIQGHTIRATLCGKVALVRRVGRPSLPPGIELALDPSSLPAAGFLAMAARGEQVSFRERLPRFVVERELLARWGGKENALVTANVSEGGCAAQWPGALPLTGDVVTIKLGRGLFAPSAQAVVCWNTLGGPLERAVGLRIILEGRAGRAWKALVSEVARSGARAA
jgi:hypothetical protein